MTTTESALLSDKMSNLTSVIAVACTTREGHKNSSGTPTIVAGHINEAIAPRSIDEFDTEWSVRATIYVHYMST